MDRCKHDIVKPDCFTCYPIDVHSCHSKCTNPACVMRRERDAVIKQLVGALKTVVGREPLAGLEPRIASDTLAAVALKLKEWGLK